MVAVSKADRFIKVSNLPQDISNDVLGFIFSESVNVERKPSSTTAIVEFGSVRDAENYILKDKTLMIENKVLGIEGFSAKNEEPSNDDPLKSRQLYIENLPRSTTTEYLDVLFPCAKSIKHLDACSAIAEYRTAKDAERELLKSKSLRIDRHKLFVRLAKDCHRFGGGEPDPHEKGHTSTTDRSSISNANKSNLKKSASGKDDFVFSGKDIPSDLYGLPAEFGRSSRQRKDDKQNDSFKKPLDKSPKKGAPSNKTSAKAATLSPGKAKSGISESKNDSGNHSAKLKSPNKAKLNTSSSGGSKTSEKSGSSNQQNKKQKIIPNLIIDRSKYTWVDTRVYGSANQKSEQPIKKDEEEHHKQEDGDDQTRETQARGGEDKRNIKQNRRRMDRARSDERERPEFKRRILSDEIWREVKVTGRSRSRESRRASCERFDFPLDDYNSSSFSSTHYNLEKRLLHGSERGPYRDHSVYDSKLSPDRVISSYKFRRDALDLASFRNSSDFDKRVANRTVVREDRWLDRGERENKVPFPPRIYRNLKWTKEDSKTDSEGQNKKSVADDSRNYDKGPILDRKRFNEESNLNQDVHKRYQDRYDQGLNWNRDDDPFIDKDRSSRGSVTNKRKFDDSVLDSETSRRRIERGSNLEQRIFDIAASIKNERFNRKSSVNQGRFSKSSNMDRERFTEGLNRDQGKLDWNQNMDQERYDRGSNVDHRKFDKNSNIARERFEMRPDRDPGRFDRSSDRDPGRFDRSSVVSQGGFVKSSKPDQSRLGVDSDINREGFHWGSNMNSGRFERTSKIEHETFNRVADTDLRRINRGSNVDANMEREVFDHGSNVDSQRSTVNRGMSNNSSSMDIDLRFNQDRFTRNAIRDQEILNTESNRSYNRLDRDFRIDQGRFDSSSSVRLERFEKSPTVDQNLFRNHSKQEQSSNSDPSRFNRVPQLDQSRFEKGSTVDQSLFGSHSKQDQSSHPDPNRFTRFSNINQGRFEKGSTVDQFENHSKQDQSLNTDPNRFNRAPMDQGRFGRGPNIVQAEFERDQDMVKSGGFDRYANVDRNRFSRDQNIDQDRPGMGPNIDQTRFGKGSDTDPNRLDRYSNQDQNRFHAGQNRDQSRFNNSGANRNQERFDQSSNNEQNWFNQNRDIDHRSANLDKSGFGNNFNNQWLSTNWKSDKFARNDTKTGVDYRSDMNTNSKQCWGGPPIDNSNNVLNRRELLQGRQLEHTSHPEKRTFSNIQADDQWKTNMTARNFRHESREESCQEFPNKRPRKEVGYNNEDGYFNAGSNRPRGQNNLTMNSYPSHTPALHHQPLSFSSSRLPVMQSSLTSNASQHHLASSNRL